VPARLLRRCRRLGKTRCRAPPRHRIRHRAMRRPARQPSRGPPFLHAQPVQRCPRNLPQPWTRLTIAVPADTPSRRGLALTRRGGHAESHRRFDADDSRLRRARTSCTSTTRHSMPASAAAPASSTASAAQAARRSPAPTPRSSCSRAPYGFGSACRHREARIESAEICAVAASRADRGRARPATQDRQLLMSSSETGSPVSSSCCMCRSARRAAIPWISRDSSSSDFASVPELFRNHSRSSPSHPSCSAVRNRSLLA